jgi:hypothetical protein
VGVLDRRRVDEHGFREVRLAREQLERLLRDLARVGEDGERVPARGVSVKTSTRT